MIRRAVYKRSVFLVVAPFGDSDFLPGNGRGQNTLETEFFSHSLGWSDPTILLGSHRLPRVGSLQPNTGFARVQIDRRATRNLYAPNNFRSPEG